EVATLPPSAEGPGIHGDGTGIHGRHTTLSARLMSTEIVDLAPVDGGELVDVLAVPPGRDVLAAVRVRRHHVHEDRALHVSRIRLLPHRAQALDQGRVLVRLHHPGVPEHLETWPGGIVDEDQACAPVVVEVARGGELPVPPELEPGEPGGGVDVDEARGPAAVLYIRPPRLGDGGEEEVIG